MAIRKPKPKPSYKPMPYDLNKGPWQRPMPMKKPKPKPALKPMSKTRRSK